MYKVLLIGDVAVGKTAFVHRIVNNTFKENYQATLGVDFALKTLELENGQPVKVQLWDIAGNERVTSMTRVYYKGASACILMFDLCNRYSFEHSLEWKRDLDEKVFLSDDKPIPCLLLANKVDLSDQTVVTTPEIKKFAAENDFVGWKLCSVKENQGLDEGLRLLMKNTVQRCSNIATSADDAAFSIDPTDTKKNPLCC